MIDPNEPAFGGSAREETAIAMLRSSRRDPPSRGIPTVVISLDLELAWGSFAGAPGEGTLDARRGRPAAVVASVDPRAQRDLGGRGADDGRGSRPWSSSRRCPIPTFRPALVRIRSAGCGGVGGPRVVRPVAGSADSRDATRPGNRIPFLLPRHVRAPRNSAGPGPHGARLVPGAGGAAGFEGTAFVFPRNSVGHVDELKFAGFRCYRSLDCLPGCRVG